MRKFLVILFLGVITTMLLAQNNTPVVSNSRFEQRTDGSVKVDFFYDENEADGEGISSGTGKHKVWDFGVEHPNTFSDKFILEISADDNTGGGTCGSPISYAGKTYNTVQIGDQCWLKENLETYVNDQAIKLIDQSQTMYGFTATNETGLSALFAGSRNFNNGSFRSLSSYTDFWSSTKNGNFPYYIGLYYRYSVVHFNIDYKTYGFSVRCLKD